MTEMIDVTVKPDGPALRKMGWSTTDALEGCEDWHEWKMQSVNPQPMEPGLYVTLMAVGQEQKLTVIKTELSQERIDELMEQYGYEELIRQLRSFAVDEGGLQYGE